MNFETLETERLLLRKLTPAVYDFIYANCTDEECMLHLGLKNIEQLKDAKERHSKGLEAHDRTFVIFQLIEKGSGEIIGDTGFVRYYPAHFRAELGYSLIGEEHKRKGYMSEANKTVVDYGFKVLNLIRLEAYTGINNVPSIKLLQNLGFEKEGVMKKHFHRNGISEDSIIFSLLAKD